MESMEGRRCRSLFVSCNIYPLLQERQEKCPMKGREVVLWVSSGSPVGEICRPHRRHGSAAAPSALGVFPGRLVCSDGRVPTAFSLLSGLR